MSLDVEGIRVSFGGNQVLDGVTLGAADGQITALIGPNGAGKTTLFNVITGALKPESGSVRLGAVELSTMSVHQRARAGLARTFQRLELFDALTVRENLEIAASRLPRAARASRVDAVLERLGLTRHASVRSGTLPTGSGRMVELARALVTGPQVLLLDEPASGQTAQETEVFSQLLGELADDGLTIVLVEHDMGLVMQTARVIHVLDGGVVITSGDPAQIRADPAVQAAYLGTASHLETQRTP